MPSGNVRDRTAVKITVIIPALNEEQMIGRCLQSLGNSDFPRDSFEVVLVDNGSTDRTVEIASSFVSHMHIMVLKKPKVTVSALRNSGAAVARGEMLAFLDADCLVSKDWLAKVEEALSAECPEIVGGGVAVAEDAGWPSRVWYGVAYAPSNRTVSYVPSGNMLMRRSVFQQLAGFYEALRTSEDWDLCLRARTALMQVRAMADLAVIHARTPRTLADFYRRERWHGAHVAKMLARNRTTLEGSRTVVFAAFMLLCAAGACAGVGFAVFSRNLYVVTLFLLLMFAGAFACSLRKLHRERGRQFWSNLLPLTVLHVVYGLARGQALLNASYHSPQRNKTSPDVSGAAA